MTPNTFKEAMQDVSEIKILKSQIVNCKAAITHTFGKTEKELDQQRATLVVITDDFMIRKNRIMKFMKSAPKDQKAEIFAEMKRT